MKKKLVIFSVALFILAVLGGVLLQLWPSIQFNQKAREHKTKWQTDIKSKNPKLYENLTKAIADLEKAVLEKPKDIETLLELAATYQNFGDWKNAEKYYLKIVAIDDKNYMLWNNLSRLYREEGKYEEAKTAYLKLIEYFPKEVDGYLGLYGLYGDVSKLSENKILKKADVLYQVQQGYIVTQNPQLKFAIDDLNKQ